MGLLGAGEVGGGKGRTPLPARCSCQHSHMGGPVIFQGVIQALTAEEFSRRAEGVYASNLRSHPRGLSGSEKAALELL